MTTELLAGLEATRQLLDVSVTERMQFRTCRRRWWFSTVENLTPRQRTVWYYEFGTGLHAALEVYYLMPKKDRLAAALDAFDEWYHTVEVDGPDEADELDELLLLGREMLTNYPVYEATTSVTLGNVLAVEGQLLSKKLTSMAPDGYPPVRIEGRRVLVPIVDPETLEPLIRANGQVACLSMRLDLITERKTPKSGIWIVDHKSAESAPNDRGIDFDDQITGYCYGTWRWLGVIPRGVVYNVLVKQEPKEPRFVQVNKGNPTGLSYAKDQLTTPAMYREALKDTGLMTRDGKITSEAHAGCLNALLERGWDPFYKRFEVMRNEAELLNFEQRLFAEYEDMTDAHLNERKRYPNASTWNCPSCPVNKICQAIEDGSDYEDVIEHAYVVGPDRKAAE